MSILVFDPANCTGWALLELGTARLIEYGFFKIKSCDLVGDQLIEMMGKAKLLIERFKPKHIVVEDYFFSRKCRQGANLNPAYRASLHIVIRLLGLEYTIVNPINWKRFIAGRVRPTKQEIVQWGKEKSKKEMIRHALDIKYNIKFPDDITDETGKKCKLKYDVIDATAMGIYYIKSLDDVQ